ncbi:MAG: AraC family transcriptional regulator [Verrucomicrobiota bacterium]
MWNGFPEGGSAIEFSDELKRSAAGLPEPASPAAYFEGVRRVHACALDDILIFARQDARSLRRRSAESHLHRRFVLVVCVETAGTVSIDGVPYALKPGEAHLVFPQSYHHFLGLEQNDLLWLLITFESEETERLEALRRRTLQLTAEDDHLFRQMIECFANKHREGEADRLNLALSSLLCRWCGETEQGERAGALPPTQKYSGLWQRLSSCLETIPPEELRVGPVASRLSISERHLRMKFLEQFGVSLGSYLKNYRIRRAIGLLASSDLSQAEIADQCGYRSSSSFHRAFLQHTGMSPSEFRK